MKARVAAAASTIIALLAAIAEGAEPRPIDELFATAIERLQAGEATEALEPAQECWRQQQQHLDPQALDATACATLLGNIYLTLGDLDRAFEHHRISLAHLTEAAGEDHSLTAGAHTPVAQVLWRQGKLDGAIRHYRRALAIYDRTSDADDGLHLSTAFLLAFVLREAGRPAEAVPIARQVLEGFEGLFGPDHEETAGGRHLLAGLLYETGKSSEAIEHFERTLATREKVLGPLHPLTGVTLNDFGIVLRDRGRLTEAREYLERSLSITQRSPEATAQAIGASHDNLSVLLHSLGDHERALEHSLEALAVLTEAGDVDATAIARANLATVLQQLDRRDEAQVELEAALPVLMEHPDRTRGAKALNNLAVLAWLRDDRDRALELARQAVEIEEATQGRRHQETAIALLNLGVLVAEAGELDAAERLYREALEIQIADQSALERVTLANLALLEHRRGATDEALSYLERALEAEDDILQEVLVRGTERERRLFVETGRGTANWAIQFHLLHAPDNERARRLAATTILRRKGRSLDATAAARFLLHDQLGLEARDIQKRLSELRSRRSRMAGGPGPARKIREHIDREIERMAGDLSELTPLGGRTVTLDAVLEQLDEGSALVEITSYWPHDPSAPVGLRDGERRYAAYLFFPSGDVLSVDLGESAAIDRAALSFRDSIAHRRGDVLAVGAALDRLTFAHLRPLLDGVERLILAPDGVLNLVPFAALPEPDGHYLVERFELGWRTSGRELLDQPAAGNAGPPLLLGNVDFGTAIEPAADDAFESLIYGPLPGTAAEIDRLGAVLAARSPRVLVAAEASEAALKSVRSPRFLHLATHGFFLGEPEPEPPRPPSAPLGAEPPPFDSLTSSGIALAGFNRRAAARDDEEDGVLTALEMVDLELAGTEVVVLSACETGRGEVRDGQGVFGLRRSLVLAGSRSQLTTLWQVADEATQQLMVSWYSQLEAGAGRAAALRQVQLAALSGQSLPAIDEQLTRGSQRLGEAPDDPRLAGGRHPYYWAGLVLSGEPGPLRPADSER